MTIAANAIYVFSQNEMELNGKKEKNYMYLWFYDQDDDDEAHLDTLKAERKLEWNGRIEEFNKMPAGTSPGCCKRYLITFSTNFIYKTEWLFETYTHIYLDGIMNMHFVV